MGCSKFQMVFNNLLQVVMINISQVWKSQSPSNSDFVVIQVMYQVTSSKHVYLLNMAVTENIFQKCTNWDFQWSIVTYSGEIVYYQHSETISNGSKTASLQLQDFISKMWRYEKREKFKRPCREWICNIIIFRKLRNLTKCCLLHHL